MEIKLAIFDFDGTIMDTRDTIIMAKQDTMKQLGLVVADEETCAATIGLSAKLGFQKIYPELTQEELEVCVQTYRSNFEKAKEMIPPVLFPDIIAVLEQLKAKDIVCTIATSRNNKSLEEFLEKLHLKPYFSYVLGGEDTALLKPNPEPVLKTLQDLSYLAEQTLVIGDMPVDMQMGKGAGVYTCGVTYGNSDRKQLLAAGADYVIDKIADLPDLLF